MSVAVVNLSKHDLLALGDVVRSGTTSSIADLGLFAPLRRLYPARPHREVLEEHTGSFAAVVSRDHLGVLATLDEAFVMRLPDAPGYVVAGGVRKGSGTPGIRDEFSVTGVGVTVEAALIRAAGECAELSCLFGPNKASLSRIVRGHTPTFAPLKRVDFPGRWAPNPLANNAPQGWLKAEKLTDNTEVLVPADLCLNVGKDNGDNTSSVPLTEGCGAGSTKEAAIMHGLYELIERDAYCQWWFGARPARQLRFSPSDPNGFHRFMRRIRGESPSRQDVVLDITTDLGVPCIAAVSFGGDGSRIACGTAANVNKAQAVESAYREMCQLELGYFIADLRCQNSGRSTLNAHDQAKIRQGDLFNIDTLPIVRPKEIINASEFFRELKAPSDIIHIAEMLTKKSIGVFIVDLISQYSRWHVIKALSPELQPGNIATTTRRFDKIVSKFGGTARFTYNLNLL